MNPPKSKTTIRIATNLGPASQFANSPMTVIELKGRTDRERGEHYLQLSLAGLRELADLLEDDRLSADDKVFYNRAYTSSRDRYDEVKRIRNQLLAQRKSLRKFLVNLFVRESDARRFYRVSYDNYSTIRTTSEDLHRQLLPNKEDILASISSGEATQCHASVARRGPRDVVEDNRLVKDLPPNETIRGINLDVHTEQEANEALAMLNRIAISAEQDDDDDQTIRPSTSESRPPSPSPSCTVIYNYNFFNQSVVSVDSEMTGTVVNCGGNEGIGFASCTDSDTNKLQ